MSKAVLVLDMPNNCLECKIGKSGTYGGIYCEALKKFCCGKFYSRENDCPLKELPEKKNIDCCYDLYKRGRKVGWNECLEAILSE